jgi:NO-binding membrane sensor protein with MHYT domain
MNIFMPSSYATSLVALSFVISVVGAFVALTAAAGIVRGGQRISVFNAVASGTALGGIGVWAMHFVGMLSVQVDMAVSYSLLETVASFLAAIGCSSAALLMVARRPDSLARVMGAGLMLGIGVSVMHYLGMAGMRFGGYLQWSWTLVAVSVGIAVAAATAALWLAFFVRSLQARFLAALVMAAAVCAMHYTGMEAASFICTTPTPQTFPQGSWLLTSLDLPILVSIAALGMAFVIFTDQMFQRLERQRLAPRMPAPKAARQS